jgi:transposase-like protein
MSLHTVAIFYKHFRQLIAASLEPKYQVIGVPDVVVEIDETKVGKRKYNRGHRVEGTWVVAGVERSKEHKAFVIQVDKRDSSTLQCIIEKHVLPETIILTDLWRGYNFLNNSETYHHGTVNHSQCFKDPVTGVHTNMIEGTNFAITIFYVV